MASFGHIAIGFAAGRAWVGRGSSMRLAAVMAGFSVVSMLPDADVVSFALGIPYGAPFGHRGATHSLMAAGALALLVGLVTAGLRGPFRRLTAFTAVVAMSHGLLDTLTTGGLGCALFWPFSQERFFAPVRPIPVAPIGLGMLSTRGLTVVVVEVALFLPFLAYAFWPRPETQAH